MDELIEIHSDTNINMDMDICNKNESSQLVLSSKSSTDDKKNGIDVHMLEGKVKTAMVKLQEIIANKKRRKNHY